MTSDDDNVDDPLPTTSELVEQFNAYLLASASCASRKYDLLETMSTAQMLAAETPEVRVLGIQLAERSGELTINRCVEIISSDPSVEVASFALGALSTLASCNHSPDLRRFCLSIIRDEHRQECIRVAAYKALLYITDRTLTIGKFIYQIRSLNDLDWSIIDDLSTLP
jgi:hypothetical protein